MLTDAHRRTLETLADPSRRAGLRPDEREAVRAALEEVAKVARLERERDALIAAVVEYPPGMGRWRWQVGLWNGDGFTSRAEAIVDMFRTLGLEVPS